MLLGVTVFCDLMQLFWPGLLFIGKYMQKEMGYQKGLIRIRLNDHLIDCYNQIKMSSGQFPREKFNSSLLVTTKMKSNMKPFIEEYTKGNILWMYQSVSILLNNFLSAAVQPQIKMNSMFAIKCMVDTCDYVLIALIQAYILPVIRRIAAVDITLKQQQRGLKLFSKNDKGDEKTDRIGYTYVKLSYEILTVLSVMKPKNLFYNNEIQDPSQFKLAFDEISKQAKQNSDKFVFYKEDPKKLREIFLKKVQQFDANSQKYSQYIEEKFFQQLKAGFVINQSLDVRELLKHGDPYIADDCIQSAGNYISEGKSYNIIRHALQFITTIVLSGNNSVSFLMHENQGIKKLVSAVINAQTESKKLDRGEHFLLEKKGPIEDRKLLYTEFLKSLELWGSTYTKNSLIKEGKSSNIGKYYQILKKNHQIQFPKNLLLEKQIKQAEQNFNKNKFRNKQIQKIAKDQLKQQKEDSIILSKNKIQSEIKPQASNKIIQQSNLNVSKKQVTPQPKQDEGKQCRDLIKNIKKDLVNLQKNQRELPTNMKAIEKNLEILLKKIEQVQLEDNELEILMGESIDLEEKFQKIKPVYQDYKKNKIDYQKFCDIIYPKSSKAISMSKIPKAEQPKEQISQNILPTKSVLKQENHNKENPSQSSIKNMVRNDNELVSIKQNSKQNSKLSVESKKIIIEQKVVDAPFILPAEQNSQKGLVSQHIVYKSQPYKIKIQSSQALENKQKGKPVSEFKKEQDTPVKFQMSELNESRYTITPEKKIQQNINHLKINKNNERYDHQNIANNADYRPITYTNPTYTNPATPIANREEILENITQTPIKKNTGNQCDSILAIHNELKQHDQEEKYSIDEEMIQGPSLNPLTFSYHDFQSKENKNNKKMKSFKQAINNDNYFIKSNKNSHMFWLQSEANSLMRPAVNTSLKKSQANSKLNVTELLQQRNKKYELEMRLLQRGKDMKIKQLENRLNAVEKQKSMLSHQIKAKQNEINTIRAYSDVDPAKSRADQYSIADDQNYVMKKLVAANTHQKKLGESMKNQSSILATGELINTKVFQNLFRNITDEKVKKTQMKNKELLYKDQFIEIGYMGHLEGNTYTVACFITPEGNFSLIQLGINAEQKLRIQHDIQVNMEISSKKQVRRHFYIQIQDIPFAIPQIVLLYRINGKQQSAKFILPCAFHKFFTIEPKSSKFDYQFGQNNIIRGQQVPYSRKILKNADLLHDFLPHIQKLNKGQTNNLGEICFGGEARYKGTKFLIKISVKPNQFLYIQVEQPKKEEDLKIIQFYIATLNHLLMKDFSWS